MRLIRREAKKPFKKGSGCLMEEQSTQRHEFLMSLWGEEEEEG